MSEVLIVSSASIRRTILVTLLACVACQALGQTYLIKGNVRTSATAVQSASVTFLDRSDTSKRFSALTDRFGNFQLSVVVTKVSEIRHSLPEATELAPNYPNPFSCTTAIAYKLGKQTDVHIKIFDILGREIRSLNVNDESVGTHAILWDGTNNAGNKVATGIYFYQLTAGNESHVKKMAFMGGTPAVSPSPVGSFASRTRVMIKPGLAQASPGIYTVQIKNTDASVPKISTREYYSVTIQQDTTLNFEVKGSTHYNMNLYVGSRGYDQVYVVDTDSDAVIDTLTGFTYVSDVTPTRSGRKVYVTTKLGINRPGFVYSVDPRTKVKTQILDKPADVYVGPNGTPFIMISTPYDSMRQVGTIDTVTDAVSVLDSLDIYTSASGFEEVVFHPLFPIFYTWNHQMQFFAYDYQQRRILGYFPKIGALTSIVGSLDGRYIYFAGGPVFDVAIDSLVGWVGSGYGQTAHGRLALSLDGLHLYITDPANYSIPEPVPSGRIGIFATSTESYTGFIDVNSAVESSPTDRMVIMPDGRKAYVSDGIADLFVVDLETNQVVDMIRFLPHNIMTIPIAVAPK